MQLSFLIISMLMRLARAYNQTTKQQNNQTTKQQTYIHLVKYVA